MRISLLHTGCMMLALAGALAMTPALAQDTFDGPPTPEELLPDPPPVARPLYPPGATTLAESAVESPAARQDGRAARTGHVLPCAPVNPCAVSTPLPGGKAG